MAHAVGRTGLAGGGTEAALFRRHKRCPGCCGPGETLPRSAFARDRARPDGLASQCRWCKQRTQRSWYARNRKRCVARARRRSVAQRAAARDALWAFLSANPCADCGEADPVVLDCHHFDPALHHKDGDVAQMVSIGASWEKIEREIKKCIVLCANCHRRRTARECRHWRGARAYVTTAT